jgi:hypothetical protein
MSEVREVSEGDEALAGLPTNKTGVPSISHDLLLHLEKLYPPRCKSAVEPLEVHMEYAGHVKLIAKMRQWYEAQKINVSRPELGTQQEDQANPTRIIDNGSINPNGVLNAARAAGPRMGSRRGLRNERNK